jgi:hypothetical protein
MDIRSLPRWTGNPDVDEGIGWAEPDGHGKRPSLRFRDCIVLLFLIFVPLPLVPCLVFHTWLRCERTEMEYLFLIDSFDIRTKQSLQP